MKVQHNISALNTNRILNNNQTELKKFFEKLSSGLRINRAGDDAAGLSISEKMRGQIRGFNMSGKNIQDGIALIQTAEGAMNEIHSLLQRGRELAIQASNDTNTATDRNALQEEVSQILDEIDGISNRTEFNGMRLLQGGGTVQPPGGSGEPGDLANDTLITSKAELTSALIEYMLETSEDAVFNAYGVGPIDGKEITVKYVNQSPGGAVAWVSTSGYPNDTSSFSFELVIDEADFLTGDNLWISKDRIIAHEMAHAMMAASGMDWLTSTSIPGWFKEGSAEYLAGANERLKGSLSFLGSAQNVVNAIDASPSSSHFYSAGYVATRYLDKLLNDAGKNMKTFMKQLATGESFDQTVNFQLGMSESQFKSNFLANGASFIEILNLTGSGSILGDSLADEDVISDTPNPIQADHFKYIWSLSTGHTGTSPFISLSDPTIHANGLIKLQLGANSGQSMEVTMKTVNTSSLGIADTNVSLFSSLAITQFDDAINTLSGVRSELGAIHNRLEHAYEVSTNSAENLQSAESRIRDLDIAKEMMTQTKLSILAQSSTAMLAQSNQQSQFILNILQ